ncbi:MAG: hypothetical protein ACYC4A_13620 [Desulfobulbia bacterium]
MKAYFLFPLIAVCIVGCAGLDITPISPADEVAAHAGGTNLKGYIIYEPMVVVEVSPKELCIKKDDKGTCTETTTTCSAGAPFILPDTSKPFLVNVRSGFGTTGVDVTIANGWQLGNFKDNSDNTALLGTVEKVLGFSLKGGIPVGTPSKGECKDPGLYRVTLTSGGEVTLSLLKVYQDRPQKK